MAGLRPLDQLGTEPCWTLAEPRFAASLPLRVMCGGIRARHDSLLGLPDQSRGCDRAARRGRRQHDGDLRTATVHRARLHPRACSAGHTSAWPGGIERGQMPGRLLYLLLHPQKKPVSSSKPALDLGGACPPLLEPSLTHSQPERTEVLGACQMAYPVIAERRSRRCPDDRGSSGFGQ